MQSSSRPNFTTVHGHLNHLVWLRQAPPTQNHLFGPTHFCHVKKSAHLSVHSVLFSESCQSQRLAFIIERKIKFLTMFSLLPNPFHFFIGRMAKSIKIHTKVFSATLPIPCSQISVSRRRAPAPLKIQTKAPLLPGGGGRREGRLESSIFWATSLSLTCFLPQRKWT